MNKISKKIVSAVTMGAFVLTLAPTAIFGATLTKSSAVEIGQSIAGQVDIDFNTNATGVGIKMLKADGTAFTIQGDNSGAPAGNDLGDTDGGLLETNTSGDVQDDYVLHITGVPAGNYTIGVTANNGATTLLPNTQIYVAAATSTSNSRLLLNQNGSAVSEVKAGTNASVKFEVRDTENEVSKLSLNDTASAQYVLVWAEDAQGNMTNDVTFSKDADSKTDLDMIQNTYNSTLYTPSCSAIGTNTSGAQPISVKTGDTVTATFTVAGEYTIHSAVITAGPTTNADKIENTGVAFVGKELQPAKVTVTKDPVAVKTTAIDFTSDAPATLTPDGTDWTLTLNDDVVPNDTKTYTVTGTAYTNKASKTPAVGEKIYISCPQNGYGIELKGLAADGSVTTDANGQFSFKYILSETGSYEIKYQESAGDISGTLTITQNNVSPVHIKTVENNGVFLAGNDINYAADVYSARTYLSDAVTFSIIDAFGHEAEGTDVLAKEEAAYVSNTSGEVGYNHADYVRIVNKPEATETTPASTLEANDIVLAWNGSAYTLAYVGDNRATDLVPGEYEINVSLNNGGDNVAKAKFTLAPFGKVQDIVLDMTAVPAGSTESQNNSIIPIDDQVALGQTVTVEPNYVDENGIKVPVSAKNLSVGINGDAVKANNVKGPITFTTFDNTPANNSLIGSTITVKVFDKNNAKYVEKELTVVKNYLAETLSFDSEQGEVGKDNVVNVSVVDADGKVSKVEGTMSAYIADQSNADAKIDLDVDKTVSNGKGKIYLESDAETTADIVVVVTATNGEMYGATLHYTFGKEDPYAGRTVVMTIGSADYIINNKVVEGDAAPYVDSAWRTMVPVRVLAESFGADVDYTDGVVTIVDGDTTIVMNVGEDTYTINDAEQTMDTAPVIGAGDRTYVPVRFVAEGLGYEVTPLYDAENGTTASVAFQK